MLSCTRANVYMYEYKHHQTSDKTCLFPYGGQSAGEAVHVITRNIVTLKLHICGYAEVQCKHVRSLLDCKYMYIMHTYIYLVSPN